MAGGGPGLHGALVAGWVLAYEVVLLRALAEATGHPSGYLVFTLALLGSGASGVAFSLAPHGSRGPARLPPWTWTLAVAASLVLTASLAPHLPVESRILPDRLGAQAAGWAALVAVLALPFLVGGAALCATLARARDEGPVARVYAAQCAGGALGALLAPLLLASHSPLALAPDPFKSGSELSRAAREGHARRRAVRPGTRGRLELWEGSRIHDLPFLAGALPPPPMLALLRDGDRIGSVLRIGAPESAAVLDSTLPAFAYELLPDAPRVALLGETGGTGAWLAARRGARSIAWVQADARVFELLAALPREDGGAVLALPGLTRVPREPHEFVALPPGEAFDLLYLAGHESAGAGSGNLAGAAEDHLLTVETLVQALACLAPRGLLGVARAIKDPPRDELRILVTFLAALAARGADRPGSHLVVARDFLGLLVLARPTPFGLDEGPRIRAALASRGLTPVWFPGMADAEGNRPDRLRGPPGGSVDWYRHALGVLAGPDGAAFLASWPYEVGAPTDDRPYFRDLARLRTLPALARTHGALWPTRVELGFVFVLAALAAAALAGTLLLALPWALDPGLRATPDLGREALYFAALGVAYMGLEMVVLARLGRLTGDPALASAVGLAAMLAGSGSGSLALAQAPARFPGVRRLAGLLALATLGLGLLPPPALPGLDPALRLGLAILPVTVLAFFMGMPMPAGLAALPPGRPARVGFAWAANGFASVLAPPLWMALAMSAGHRAATVVAAGAYLLAALVAPRPATDPGQAP